MKKRLFLPIFALLASFASAHGDELAEASSWNSPNSFIIYTAALLAILSIMFFFRKEYGKKEKKILFLLVTVPVVLSTLYLGVSTIYENVTSITKGPIHWHADYHVYVCGEKQDLVNPKFPRNKVGTPLFHEHDDDRMHVEGTVSDWHEISLGHYFEVIGGILETGHLAMPTNDGYVEVRDGDSCPDGSTGTLKVYINGRKTEDYTEYVIYPNPYVPPGDCIMYIFDSSDSPTTDRLCESWEVKGWNYDSYSREQVTIGDRTWQ